MRKQIFPAHGMEHLNVAGELHLVLHVTQLNDGTYSGTLDSPDQNVSGIKCDKVEIKTDATGNNT